MLIKPSQGSKKICFISKKQTFADLPVSFNDKITLIKVSRAILVFRNFDLFINEVITCVSPEAACEDYGSEVEMEADHDIKFL